MWSRPPGLRGLGPTWKGGDREGRLSRLAPGVPEASSWAVRWLYRADLPPGLSELRSRSLWAEDFPIGCVI